MSGKDSLSERIADAARQLQDEHDDPNATLRLAVELAHDNVDGCDGAALSLVRSRKVAETVAATDDMVKDVDRLQHELGEGPSLDAIWDQPTTYSPSIRHDHRWPSWGQRVAEETAVVSVASFRLFTRGDTLGALSLYSRCRAAFDEEARGQGLALAAHVAIASSQKIRQLSVGLASRTVIGQATGVLMERFDLDAARAFGVLERLSSHHNIKLRDVAAEVVAHREHLDLSVTVDHEADRERGA